MTRRLLATLTATLTVVLLTGPSAIAYGPSGPPTDGGGGGDGGANGGGSGGGAGPDNPMDEEQNSHDPSLFAWKTHRVPGCGLNIFPVDQPCQSEFLELYEDILTLSDGSGCEGRCHRPDRRDYLACSDDRIGDNNNVFITRGGDWEEEDWLIGDPAQWDVNAGGKCKREKLLWCLTSKRCDCIWVPTGVRVPQVRPLCVRRPNDDDRWHSLGVYAFSANGSDCRAGRPWGGQGPALEDFEAEGDCLNQEEVE